MIIISRANRFNKGLPLGNIYFYKSDVHCKFYKHKLTFRSMLEKLKWKLFGLFTITLVVLKR